MTKDASAWDDVILPFQLDRSGLRGRFVRLDKTLDRILSQHDYPEPVSQLVAEAALLTALIGDAIKLRWKLSLQIRGNGPLRLIATDYFAPRTEAEPARLRAYAGFDPERLADAPERGISLLGEGYFAILIDQGEGTHPYQGITPLAGRSLAECAESYFAQSEQLPTRFHTLATQAIDRDGRHWRAGGIMLQHLPRDGGHAHGGGSGEGGLLRAADLVRGEEGEDWNRAVILMESVQPEELVGPALSHHEVLYRLFHEETPRVFTPRPIEFGCTCSEERVRRALSIYSAKDIAHMTTEDGKVTADCQFCGAHYELAPETVGLQADGK